MSKKLRHKYVHNSKGKDNFHIMFVTANKMLIYVNEKTRSGDVIRGVW